MHSLYSIHPQIVVASGCTANTQTLPLDRYCGLYLSFHLNTWNPVELLDCIQIYLYNGRNIYKWTSGASNLWWQRCYIVFASKY